MAGPAMPPAHGCGRPFPSRERRRLAAHDRSPVLPRELAVRAERFFARDRVQPSLKETAMKVSDIMTRDVRLANPSQKLREVAGEMEKHDIGVLPVGENDRLVGMITDRDIAVRGISHGLGPDAAVRDVMSSQVRYCFEDDDIEEIAQNMADEQIRRLPVLDGDKRLVGIVSLGDLAVSNEVKAGEVALSGICQSGGQHCQSAKA
jgi:CBS domain-containing protein